MIIPLYIDCILRTVSYVCIVHVARASAGAVQAYFLDCSDATTAQSVLYCIYLIHDTLHACYDTLRARLIYVGLECWYCTDTDADT